jgi:alpha-amylase
MYQPVSYRLQGRMGSRDDLRKLVGACRKVGVRVYADAVINHMTGGGNDMSVHRRDAGGGNCITWGNKSSSLPGGPSPFYTQSNVYQVSPSTGYPPSQEFPAAAYGPLDFHCERVLNAWNDPLQLNAGWLTGLTDLNTERTHVQERIAAYLTDLIGIGFSGFRIDAAKHIQPDDLVAILGKLRANLGGALPADFITWLEVLLGGEADLLMCNADSGYNYGGYLLKALKAAGLSDSEAAMVKIWNSGYPKEPSKGLVDCNEDGDKARTVVQNDDADQQNPGSSSRDMGDQGCVLVKGCSVDKHRAYEVKLFEAPNGASDNDHDYPIRVVLSSFYWSGNGVQGIPDGKSNCALCTVNCAGCESVPYIKAHDDTSQGYDTTGYTRVHRDGAIIAAMRKWMHI